MSARPEVTGRAVFVEGAPGADAFSIAGFCLAHGISEAFYHKLRKLGLGPREMRLCKRVLISREAAADWRKARESAA